MRLPFLRPREPQADRSRAAAAGVEPGAIDAARTRARQRLVGALVLLVIGVVGFPILFETQPRPLPVNTPILVAGAASAPAEAAPPPIATPRPAAPPVLPPVDAGVEPAPVAPPAAPPAAVVPAAETPRTKPAVAESARVAVTPASAPARPAASAPAVRAGASAPLAPAAAASEAASAAKSGRFVVQVGAFTDPTALRDVRVKVEKLGFKTYTQVVEVEGSKRTRVRVGPYDSREEADAAANKLKRAGLGPAVLAL